MNKLNENSLINVPYKKFEDITLPKISYLLNNKIVKQYLYSDSYIYSYFSLNPTKDESYLFTFKLNQSSYSIIIPSFLWINIL